MNKHIDTYQNSKGLARYVDYEEEGLKREESDFTSSNGDNLKGYYYSDKLSQDYKGVIVVNNGFGSGHEAMLGEIQTFAACGYLVYGFDKTGYDESDGNGIGSLSQGVEDLLKAIEHVKESEISANLDIILYGKSYGAYCCLSVLNQTDDVSKVISLSAFNRSSDMIKSEVTRKIGVLGNIFVPFLRVFDYINEKSYNACDGILNTDADVLIMHSKDDCVVPFEDSYTLFQEKAKGNNKISFIHYDNKGHDIIKSDASVQYNEQMDADLQEYAKAYDDEMTEDLWKDFLSRYDLKKCTEPDQAVFSEIENFMEFN